MSAEQKRYRFGNHYAESILSPGWANPLFTHGDLVASVNSSVEVAVREIIARLKWLEKTGNDPDALPGLGDVIQEIRQVFGISEDQP